MELKLQICFIPTVLFTIFKSAGALTCYKCDGESNNWGACVVEQQQCSRFQDACTTYTRWGVPPYWTPRGDRQHFISKDCDTRQGCENRRSALQSFCKRDWYNDWSCVECCIGDLCNYYVTLGAPSMKTNIVSILSLAIVGMLLRRNLL